MNEWLSNPWLLTLFLLVGLVVLVKGADWLVDGASSIAKRWGISDLVIGLTVVAFGTSMPEFVVNMVSVADGATDLAITNVLGSNIINTFVILGLTALVYPIATQQRMRDFDIPMSMICGVVVVMMIAIMSPLGETTPGITRIGGLILLSFFIYFLYNTFRHAKDHPEDAEEKEVKIMPLWKALLLVLVGLAGLVIGGELIVKSAVQVATQMGVSEAIIGLTIVALGTSLPELATSVVAALKHNSDIAIGNVFGSNIFNVFFVLGTSAILRPLPAYEGILLDAVMATAGSIIVWLCLKTNKERQLQRWGGAVLLLAYAGYLAYRLMNI